VQLAADRDGGRRRRGLARDGWCGGRWWGDRVRENALPDRACVRAAGPRQRIDRCVRAQLAQLFASARQVHPHRTSVNSSFSRSSAKAPLYLVEGAELAHEAAASHDHVVILGHEKHELHRLWPAHRFQRQAVPVRQRTARSTIENPQSCWLTQRCENSFAHSTMPHIGFTWTSSPSWPTITGPSGSGSSGRSCTRRRRLNLGLLPY